MSAVHVKAIESEAFKSVL